MAPPESEACCWEQEVHLPSLSPSPSPLHDEADASASAQHHHNYTGGITQQPPSSPDLSFSFHIPGDDDDLPPTIPPSLPDPPLATSRPEAAPEAPRDTADSFTLVVGLIHAASMGNVGQMRQLLDLGADPDARDYDLRSALHLAASEGHAGAVELLLGSGATVNPADRWGNTPLSDSKRALAEREEGRYKSIISLLESRGGRCRTKERGEQTKDEAIFRLCHSASTGNLEDVLQQLEQGGDPNAGDYDQRTALHVAAAEGHLAVVELLLEKGACVNPRDRWGNTPLSDAQRARGDDDIVRVLKFRGGVCGTGASSAGIALTWPCATLEPTLARLPPLWPSSLHAQPLPFFYPRAPVLPPLHWAPRRTLPPPSVTASAMSPLALHAQQLNHHPAPVQRLGVLNAHSNFVPRCASGQAAHPADVASLPFRSNPVGKSHPWRVTRPGGESRPEEEARGAAAQGEEDAEEEDGESEGEPESVPESDQDGPVEGNSIGTRQGRAGSLGLEAEPTSQQLRPEVDRDEGQQGPNSKHIESKKDKVMGHVPYVLVELGPEELLAEYRHFCPVCDKAFKRDANMRIHMRGHGTEYRAAVDSGLWGAQGADQRANRYTCPVGGCRRHKLHQNFKPLKTLVCLKNHYKRTHGQKLYKCAKCSAKEFSVLSDLKTHEKHCGRTDEWVCSCGNTFTRKDKLLRHVDMFDGHTPVGRDN